MHREQVGARGTVMLLWRLLLMFAGRHERDYMREVKP